MLGITINSEPCTLYKYYSVPLSHTIVSHFSRLDIPCLVFILQFCPLFHMHRILLVRVRTDESDASLGAIQGVHMF